MKLLISLGIIFFGWAVIVGAVQVYTLRQHQIAFVSDVAKLIQFIEQQPDLAATIDYAYRDATTQKRLHDRGLSETLDSKHMHRLAIDLNFFYKGVYIQDLPPDKRYALLLPIGRYWEGLGKGNIWGGNWQTLRDYGHFERQPERTLDD